MVHDHVSSELPWMTDGAGLPPHADEHLPELVRPCFFDLYFSLLASWNPDSGLSICFMNCIYATSHHHYRLHFLAAYFFHC